jgi:hypothetical protein
MLSVDVEYHFTFKKLYNTLLGKKKSELIQSLFKFHHILSQL